MPDDNVQVILPESGETVSYSDFEADANTSESAEGNVEQKDQNNTEAESGSEESGLESTQETTGESSEDNEEKEPWKAQKKSETPPWAKKRFKEFSTKVGALEEENRKLREQLKGSQQEQKELTREDFPDDESWNEHLVEKKVEERLNERERKAEEQGKQKAQAQELQEVMQQNFSEAEKEIPDLREALENGDPDIVLPNQVLEALDRSPVGPHTMYRIATDEQLSEQLKQADSQERAQIVAKIHDEILDFKIKQNALKSGQESGSEPKGEDQQIESKPPKKGKPSFKAPPKAKSGAEVDPLLLSGDEYVKYRQEKGYRRG